MFSNKKKIKRFRLPLSCLLSFHLYTFRIKKKYLFIFGYVLLIIHHSFFLFINSLVRKLEIVLFYSVVVIVFNIFADGFFGPEECTESKF
jgi:hypothetical protein